MMNILLQSSLPFLPSVRVAETYVAVRIFYWGVAPCLWSVSLSFDHRSGCECADACLSRTTFHTKSCTITVKYGPTTRPRRRQWVASTRIETNIENRI